MSAPGREPTPEEVRGLWAWMTHRFGSSVINKDSASEMQLVSTLLAQLGIVDKEDFLRNYVTTVGSRIYVPFTIGVPVGEWDLYAQLVVCAHEHQHVHQAQTLGLLTYGARYIFSPSTRADYEAEAYRATFELSWWHTRTMPDPQAVAQLLSGYGVSQTDVQVTATTLREAADSIRRGAVLNYATSVALEWLNQHAADVRAIG